MDDYERGQNYYDLLKKCELTSFHEVEKSEKDDPSTFEAGYDGPKKTYKYDLIYPEDKLNRVILLKIYKTLPIIKGCIIFFVILAIISIIAGFIIGGNISSALHNLSTTTSTPVF